MLDFMKGNTKSMIAILMGVIIAIADIYWTYTSYYDVVWVALGVIILIADVIWMYIDWSFMKK
jgi:hypothetical protein